ncbi:MAG: hypothetical protein WC082_08350 [Victivallales bacterium]|jgi:hypothetical protein
MFEDRLQEPVTLQVPEGTFSDGQDSYTEYSACALITDFTQRDINRYGTVKNGKIFLLRCDNEPLPGSRIIYEEKTYDIKDIKICRNLNGETECYRCVVA